MNNFIKIAIVGVSIACFSGTNIAFSQVHKYGAATAGGRIDASSKVRKTDAYIADTAKKNKSPTKRQSSVDGDY